MSQPSPSLLLFTSVMYLWMLDLSCGWFGIVHFPIVSFFADAVLPI